MNKDTIHVLDFKECLSVVKFLEKCGACAKKGKKCKYRAMLVAILTGKKKLDYGMRLEEKAKWADCKAGDDCPFCGTELVSETLTLNCNKCGFRLDY
jgi:hypothetical protein